MRLQSYEIYFVYPNFRIYFLPKNFFMEHTADKTASRLQSTQSADTLLGHPRHVKERTILTCNLDCFAVRQTYQIRAGRHCAHRDIIVALCHQFAVSREYEQLQFVGVMDGQVAV